MDALFYAPCATQTQGESSQVMNLKISFSVINCSYLAFYSVVSNNCSPAHLLRRKPVGVVHVGPRTMVVLTSWT
jgi:hypothetical protein